MPCQRVNEIMNQRRSNSRSDGGSAIVGISEVLGPRSSMSNDASGVLLAVTRPAW
jgi:hypothetical protein